MKCTFQLSKVCQHLIVDKINLSISFYSEKPLLFLQTLEKCGITYGGMSRPRGGGGGYSRLALVGMCRHKIWKFLYKCLFFLKKKWPIHILTGPILGQILSKITQFFQNFPKFEPILAQIWEILKNWSIHIPNSAFTRGHSYTKRLILLPMLVARLLYWVPPYQTIKWHIHNKQKIATFFSGLWNWKKKYIPPFDIYITLKK